MVDFHLTDISKVVQLVLAPAFVVAGIGTFVTILTQRLARVVDQWVKLDETHPQREVESAELGLSRDVLSRRAQMIRRAILLCTFAAIIICSLIGLLFLDAMTSTAGSPRSSASRTGRTCATGPTRADVGSAL